VCRAAGAFGAHALPTRVSDIKLLKTWDTAAHYHLIHSVALVGSILLQNKWAASFFSAGMALFSGSLYVLVLSEQKKLGAITPIGGLLLAGGWLALFPLSNSNVKAA
jgi:uncharacterized membrane protein YgdD (TMEM256/DUF423 family)